MPIGGRDKFSLVIPHYLLSVIFFEWVCAKMWAIYYRLIIKSMLFSTNCRTDVNNIKIESVHFVFGSTCSCQLVVFWFIFRKEYAKFIRDKGIKKNRHVKVRDAYLAVRILNGVYLSTTNDFGVIKWTFEVKNFTFSILIRTSIDGMQNKYLDEEVQVHSFFECR